MKVAYCATVQPAFGGLRTFNVGLVAALDRICQAGGHTLVLVVPEKDRTAFPFPDNRVLTFIGNPFEFENRRLPALLRRENVDWAVFPHNRMPVFPGSGFRSVLLVHDLLFWRFPGEFSSLKRWSRYFFLSQALKSADKVVAVSEFTRDELRAFGYQGDVSVCWEGSDPEIGDFKPENPRLFPDDLPFFAFIGAHSFQKNIPALIAAFTQIRREGLACRLILAGGKGSATQAVEAAYQLSEFKDDILRPGFVGNAEKTWLLQHARAFVFPSIYEGFGIPILEAFEQSCPVITCNRASLPEVAGDAAILCEPEPDSIAEALRFALQNPAQMRHFVEKGKRRLLDFSWDKSAEILFNSIKIK